MKLLRDLIKIGALTLASLIFSPKNTEACSSAIPIGRGGTNVAVADDASAVYWNPAGLVQLKRPELDVTISPNGIYKGFLCYGQPLNDKSAVGVNFSYREDEYSEFIGEDLNKFTAQWLWLRLGYSRELTNKLFIGANLAIEQCFGSGKVVPTYNGGKPYLNMDLGVLYKPNERFKIGLLLQGYGAPHLTSVRPGASLKLNDKTLLAIEGYDVTDVGAGSNRHARLGLERKINESWSVRGGLRVGNLNGGIEVANAKLSGNLGVSYRKGNLEISVANSCASLNKKF